MVRQLLLTTIALRPSPHDRTEAAQAFRNGLAVEFVSRFQVDLFGADVQQQRTWRPGLARRYIHS